MPATRHRPPSRITGLALAACLAGAMRAHAQSTWVAGPAFPAPSRSDCSGVAVGTAVFALGGSPGDAVGNGTCHRITVGGSAWAVQAPFESLFIDTHAVVDPTNRFITIGGYDPSNGDQGADRLWDPVEGFTGNFPQRPEGAAFCGVAVAADLAGRIFAVGGSMNLGEAPVTTAQRYDATTDTWTVIAALPSARADAAAAYDSATAAGRLLVIGGLDGAARVRTGDVASYDPATNSWSTVEYPDLPVATSGARAVRGVDGRIYVIGGRTGTGGGVITANVWRFDGESAQWQACAPLPTPRERHGAVLASDDHIWVLGGFEPAGATARVDRLKTIRCPQVVATTGSSIAWLGAGASVSAIVSGTPPYQWQWFKDGVALVDGVQVDGSVVSGAHAASLAIEPVTVQTAGTFHASVSNDCGSTATQGHAIVVNAAPPPPSANAWVVTDLHPGWGAYSYAYGSVNGMVYGSATMPVQSWTNINRPVVWAAGGAAAQDLTAIGVGGEIYGGDGNTFVGWCWYPIMIQGQLWHYRYASKWTRLAQGGFSQASIHQGGYEYSEASDVQGDVIVGTGYQDAGVYHVPTAFSWTGAASVWHVLWASPYANSGASCVDAGIPYGTGILANSGGSDAIRWATSTGQGAFIIDDTGSIHDSDGGMQVGSRDSQAMMWSGTPESARSLHVPGAQSSAADACHHGVQAGSVDGHAGVWFGSASSWRDLHSLLGPGFGSSYALGVEVLADGTIVVSGYAFPSAGGSVHAMRWVAAPSSQPDLTGDGIVDALDLAVLLAQWDGVGSADLNHDGIVDGTDLGALLAGWTP